MTRGSLAERWQSTWRHFPAGAPAAVAAAFDELTARHSEPHRRYHTLQHLEECLARLDALAPPVEHRGEVELALWFHDAVHDTGAADNEARSAELAATHLRAAGLPAESIDRVRALILATRHDAIPDDADARVVADVDLGILGEAPARFDEYERQVREEHSHVPDAVYGEERRKLLEGFLARPSVYATQPFRERFEARARENLRRAIDRLAPTLEHHEVTTNGVRLHVVQAGPQDGEVTLLLHGFPEFWMGWAAQIDALARAGYRVWAPDQRGYNTSDKPRGVDAYSIDILVEDVRGLIEQTGRPRVLLLGHDWGGAVAWLVANRYPQLVSRLVIVNAPHFSVMKHELKTNPAQRRRSAYMLFFRLPCIPELALRAANFKLLEEALRSTSRPGSFPDEKLLRYREAWRQPGALTAMLNWYRALFRPGKRRVPDPRIRVPTLLIWGVRDPALGADMARPSIELCDNGQIELFDNAGHWILHEEPGRTSALIRRFLAHPDLPTAAASP